MFLTHLKEDIDTILAHDPAARSRLEVLLCYPGVHAIIAYRAANWLWRQGFRLLGRLVSHLARMVTGIEIHPGCTIGRRVFIDHGTGVVIGETAEIGNDVTLYQGVTLGGTSLNRGKRHPTLRDGVIVGAGGQVLGPVVVGEGARVGANAVVLTDVPPGVTMVGIPGRPAVPKDREKAEAFCAYGVVRDELPDPVMRAMDALRDQITVLSARVEEMDKAGKEGVALPPPGGPDAGAAVSGPVSGQRVN